MTYSVTIRESAIADSSNIIDYLEANFNELKTSQSIKKMKAIRHSLGDFPEKGITAGSINAFLSGYYFYIHEKNVILYTFDSDAQHVAILRIFGTRQNYAKEIIKFLEM